MYIKKNVRCLEVRCFSYQDETFLWKILSQPCWDPALKKLKNILASGHDKLRICLVFSLLGQVQEYWVIWPNFQYFRASF